MQDVPPSLAAALLPRYRIERVIGVGGMATVYLAHDIRHKREVAIKVLIRDLAVVVGPDRFLAEIHTTAIFGILTSCRSSTPVPRTACRST